MYLSALISSLIARGSRKPEFESFTFVETYFKLTWSAFITVLNVIEKNVYSPVLRSIEVYMFSLHQTC